MFWYWWTQTAFDGFCCVIFQREPLLTAQNRSKVILDKSSGEVSLLEQDTIEIMFLRLYKGEKIHFMQLFSADATFSLPLKTWKNHSRKLLIIGPHLFFQSAQIQPKSQFLFHENLPPRDFSIMTLNRSGSCAQRSAYYATAAKH